MSKINIKKGDTVVVIAGEDKGKTGRVLAVLRDKDRAIVEGVNIVTKATKPSAQYPQGGLVKKEAPFTSLTSTWPTPSRANLPASA